MWEQRKEQQAVVGHSLEVGVGQRSSLGPTVILSISYGNSRARTSVGHVGESRE